MSKLARTLILAATVAALNLPGTTAVAQTNDQDTPSQQELAENWEHYQRATRGWPAELRARMQADARRALSERWTYYYHAPGCRRPNSGPGCRPRIAPTPWPSRPPR
jgi:cyclopropane fatty-acyl-phospholipid synthase-like methyltransferase